MVAQQVGHLYTNVLEGWEKDTHGMRPALCGTVCMHDCLLDALVVGSLILCKLRKSPCGDLSCFVKFHYTTGYYHSMFICRDHIGARTWLGREGLCCILGSTIKIPPLENGALSPYTCRPNMHTVLHTESRTALSCPHCAAQMYAGPPLRGPEKLSGLQFCSACVAGYPSLLQ